MSKSTKAILIYILGVIFGAFFLDVWGAKTSFIKTISIFIWTIIFLIALFYSDKHEKNNFKINFLILSIFLVNFQTIVFSEIMILKGCKNLSDSFIKNEYILDFEKSLMTRNYVYDDKTYKKHKMTDLSIKKENILERFLYQDKNLIFTDRIGYPQFYTQLVFEKNNPMINIKTVINGEEAISKISTCSGVEIFEKES